jgi:hypothetical protein
VCVIISCYLCPKLSSSRCSSTCENDRTGSFDLAARLNIC